MKARVVFVTLVLSVSVGVLFTLAFVSPAVSVDSVAPSSGDARTGAESLDDFPRGQAFGPTPGITNRKDQSLVPVGSPLCSGNDEWFDARTQNMQTKLYGVCKTGYPSDHQLFVVDPTFVGRVLHIAEYGPPACGSDQFKPYNENRCYSLEEYILERNP